MRPFLQLLTRALEPIYAARWIFLYVWSVVVAALWWVNSGVLESAQSPIGSALATVAQQADALWLVLAMVNLHFHLAETEGARRARFIAGAVILAAVATAYLSTRHGWPLGTVTFTNHLGPKFAGVPFGWPALWFVAVVSGRALAAKILPGSTPATLAVAAGLIALLTDMNLERIAAELRLYWFWYMPGTPLAASAPWRNFATWFVLATALAWLMRDFRLASSQRAPWTPALVVVLFNVLLLVGHLRLALAP